MSEEKNENVEYEVVDDKVEQKGIMNYFGAIVGGLIALILCFTEFYRFILFVVIVAGGVFIGNYVQKNKIQVKTKLKEFIDKF